MRALWCLTLLAFVLPSAAAADTLGDQFAASSGAGAPGETAVAFNATAYELAWVANGAGPNLGLLVARRFDAAGAPLGAPFGLGAFPHVYTPALAPAPGGSEFRVVYSKDIGAGIQVVGAGVDSNPAPSADAPDYDERPSLAAEDDGGALVVWQRSPGCFQCDTPVPILGQRVDASGVEVGASNFAVATGTAPHVAWSTASHEWLVAYRTSSSIERVRVSSSGAIVGAAVTIASGVSSAPALAYNPDRDEYLVVWQGLDATLGKQQIFGRRLDADGSPIGSVLAISNGPDFDYGAAPPFDGNAFDPDVAYNAAANQYAVAWTDTLEVYAQHLRGDGTFVGPRVFRVSFMGPAHNPAYHAYDPSVAANESSGQWLVAWDGDNPDHQAWARRLVAPGEAPSVSSISPTSRAAGAAAFTVTVNGANFTSASRVEWNGVTRPTSYVNAARLTATIPAGDLGVPGIASVRVATPPPGGGPSQQSAFSITPSSGAPTSTTPPALGGTAQQGEVVSCGQGTWGYAPTGFTWRWLRSGAEIGGATSPSYVLSAADVGQQISCRIFATNGSGTSGAVSSSIVPDQADPVLTPAAPGTIFEPVDPASPSPGPGVAPVDTTARDALAPRLTVTLATRRALRTVLARGLRIPVRCSEPCTLSVRVYVDAATARRLRLRFTTIGRVTRRLKRGGKATLVVRLSKLAGPRLQRAGTVRVRVQTRATDAAGNASSATRRLTLTG